MIYTIKIDRIDGEGHYLIPLDSILGYEESVRSDWSYIQLGSSSLPVAATVEQIDAAIVTCLAYSVPPVLLNAVIDSLN